MGIGSFLGGLAKKAIGFIPGVGPIANAAIDMGTTAASGGKGKLLQGLLGGDTLNAAGQGLGAIGQTQAHNRGVELDAMMSGDEMKIALDRDRRAAEADILRKVQTTSYLKDGGFKDTGPGVSANGKPFTQFDFGTRPASKSEMDTATELEKQLMGRLHNPITLSDYASKMKPGKTETAMNWLSPLLTTLGAARGAGKYQEPEATPTPAPRLPTFAPAPVNSAGQNPFSRVEFSKDKLLGN